MTGILEHNKFIAEVEHFVKRFGIPIVNQSLAHVSQILGSFALFPYENLSKILLLHKNFDQPVFRHPGNIIDDYESFRLGGTCFSLTFYLKKIMDYFQYDTDLILADMNSGNNTHTALRLNFQGGQYLLDPGYLLKYPLRIDQLQLSMDSVFLEPEERANRFTLFSFKSGNKIWRYSFENRAVTFAEYLKYWDQSFHWMTMHGIVLSRKTEDEFLYIHNNYLKKESSTQKIKGKFNEDLSFVIQEHFGIPRAIIQKAKEALLDNLHHDKELGYRAPDWVE
ncbi:MAG: arylamine N-acetyltransferase [Candidatus Marinimicrobia bacterium]|nr:arylamine N-acetyltransferase [Candidatus Neomarinimicrobiota bacterium]